MQVGRRFQKGFTIVELLVVIVVIGVLAGLVITALSEVQKRARDTKRRDDIANIKKSLLAYSQDYGDQISVGSGCGSGGNGSGWFNFSNGSPTGYPKSIAQCLQDSGFMPEIATDPAGTTSCASGNLGCRAYMKYNCPDGSSYVYANLESLPNDATATDTTCSANLDITFGMNYFIHVPAP